MIKEMIMKGCCNLTPLIAFLLILGGCSRNTAVGHRPDRDQSAFLTQHIDKIEMSRLPDALNGSTLSDADKRFITANVSTGGYEFVTVKMYFIDGEQILEINEFNYDEWVHSVTGERGKSSNGTHAIFNKIGDNWEMGEVTNYGG